MSSLIVNKKATASRNQKNALSDWKKLSAYAHSGSIAAQKIAKEQGISITVMQDGAVFKIEPNGNKTAVERNSNLPSPIFQPIQLG